MVLSREGNMMASQARKYLGLFLRTTVMAIAVLPCAAQTPDSVDTSAGNLLVVLRETRGDNQQEDSLKPFGKVRAVLADGREIDLDTSWYKFLGDMHIRLVFDAGQGVQSASSEDLRRLRLEPEEALKVAITNLRRMYGAPLAQRWSGTLMQVQGHAEDLNSSYFLDREFWQQLAVQHPEGLVAAVPRRGGLVYAPLSDEDGVAALRFSVAALYAGGPGTRLSSALYLFKEGRWSVFQPPRGH